MLNYYQRMNEIYSHLQDNESKIIFEARIDYLLSNNEEKYMETIGEYYKDWRSKELEEAIKKANPKGIIIFGCGHDGKITKKLLGFWDYEVSYFCDNYRHGEITDGIKVLSVDDVIETKRDYLIIIGSSRYGKEMYIELVQKGFSQAKILLPKYKYLHAARGRQYFDIFEPKKNEVYIDAGTFDGKTVLDFNDWTKENYKKIYAFEPINAMCEVISKQIKENCIKNIEVKNNAVWNQKETILFKEDGPGSQVNENGKIEVKGISIDDVAENEKVTFIKMDIEGSELKALEGAKRTIVKHQPRLAICIYHRPLDVIEIASYILELVPEYKFYIRHYASSMWETVLYAEV